MINAQFIEHMRQIRAARSRQQWEHYRAQERERLKREKDQHAARVRALMRDR